MWKVDWQKAGMYLAAICGVLAVFFWQHPKHKPAPLPPKEITVVVPEPAPEPPPVVQHKIPLKPKPKPGKPHPNQNSPECAQVPAQAYQYPPATVIRYAQGLGLTAEQMATLKTCIGA